MRLYYHFLSVAQLVAHFAGVKVLMRTFRLTYGTYAKYSKSYHNIIFQKPICSASLICIPTYILIIKPSKSKILMSKGNRNTSA